ncbi:hypothetical protein AAY473_014805 [Plecturocebus cupreus]
MSFSHFPEGCFGRDFRSAWYLLCGLDDLMTGSLSPRLDCSGMGRLRLLLLHWSEQKINTKTKVCRIAGSLLPAATEDSSLSNPWPRAQGEQGI